MDNDFDKSKYDYPQPLAAEGDKTFEGPAFIEGADGALAPPGIMPSRGEILPDGGLATDDLGVKTLSDDRAAWSGT